jgi:hypothetical protein
MGGLGAGGQAGGPVCARLTAMSVRSGPLALALSRAAQLGPPPTRSPAELGRAPAAATAKGLRVSQARAGIGAAAWARRRRSDQRQGPGGAVVLPKRHRRLGAARDAGANNMNLDAVAVTAAVKAWARARAQALKPGPGPGGR